MIKTQKEIFSSNFSYLLRDDTQSCLIIADAQEMKRNAELNENQDEVDDES